MRANLRAILGATAVAMAALATAAAISPTTGDAPQTTPLVRQTPTTTTATAAPPPPPEPPVVHERVLAAWTTQGLPAGAAAGVRRADGVEAVTVVRGGRLMVAGTLDADGRPVDRAPDGMGIPLDALAVDPATYPPFVGTGRQGAFAGLGADQVVLSEAGARLRRIGPGARMALTDGTTLRVTAVVPDGAARGAEIVVSHATGAEVGVTVDRFILVAHAQDHAVAAGAVEAAFPPVKAVRIVGPADGFLRHGDPVITQAVVKQRFGEFAFAERTGRDIVIDPRWVRANIGSAPAPILGRIECHRDFLAQVDAALRDLETLQQADLLDRDGYAGCYVPRLVRSGGPVSLHAWGIALDVQTGVEDSELEDSELVDGEVVDGVAVGEAPVARMVDPVVVEVFGRWGLRWGGAFLNADPIHFEWERDPFS